MDEFEELVVRHAVSRKQLFNLCMVVASLADHGVNIDRLTLELEGAFARGHPKYTEVAELDHITPPTLIRLESGDRVDDDPGVIGG